MRKTNILVLSLVTIAFIFSSFFLIKSISLNNSKEQLLLVAMLTISFGLISFVYSLFLELSKKYYELKENVIIQMSNVVKNIDETEISNSNTIVTEAISTIMNEQLEELKLMFQKNLTFDETNNNLLASIAHTLELVQGEIYLKPSYDADSIKLSANYAYYNPEGKTIEFKIGEGLIGQVAKIGNILKLENLPANYMTVASGLGKASPSNLMLAPIKNENIIYGVMEFASFKAFSKQDENFIIEVGNNISNTYHRINL